MPDFENQLRAALQRREPPPGFAERVLERIGPASLLRVAPVRRPSMWAPTWKLWGVSAVAAALIVTLLSAVTYRHAREERMARQAEMALRIASEKLNLARDGVFKNAGFRTTGEKDY